MARQASVVLEEGNKALVVVVAALLALITVSTIILRITYRVQGAMAIWGS